MMQKVNLKRITALARHLPKFLVVCVMCGIIFIGGSGKFLAGSFGIPAPQDCSPKAFVNLKLRFPPYSDLTTVRNCVDVPLNTSNPSFNGGLTFLSPNFPGYDPNKYYCKITVTSFCGDISTSVWTVPAPNGLLIQVPNRAKYTIRVDFYEQCSNCSKVLANVSRNIFEYEQEYLTAGSIFADLQHNLSFQPCI